MKTNTILVPTDFTQAADSAIEHGVTLASVLQGNLLLLHAVDQMQSGGEDAPGHVRNARELLKSYKSLAEKKIPGKVNIRVRSGNVLRVIRSQSGSLKARLMVLGTHGKSRLQTLFGSYALKLVLDAPCPVIVVQESPFSGWYRNILVPFTLDVGISNTLDWIFLLDSVFHPSFHLYVCPEIDKVMKFRLDECFNNFTRILSDAGLRADITYARNKHEFISRIIPYASSLNTDLIIITTMPGPAIPGFEFSTWVEQLMFNESRIPVMCINPEC